MHSFIVIGEHEKYPASQDSAKKIVKKYNSILCDSNVNPYQLVRKCFSDGIVCFEEYESIVDRATRATTLERMLLLMKNVKAYIDFSGNLQVFIDALRAVDIDERIAIEMGEKYLAKVVNLMYYLG